MRSEEIVVPKKSKDLKVNPKPQTSTGIKPQFTAAGPTQWIARLAWSPDGQRIATASKAKNIHIWDARLGTLLLRIPISRFHIFSASWSPDGTLLVSSHEDRFLRFWDTTTGKRVCEVEGYPASEGETAAEGKGESDATVADREADEIRDAQWSPDGSRLASVDEFGVRIWSATTFKLEHIFREHPRGISVQWSRDGRFVASTSYDGGVRIFDVEQRALKHVLKEATYTAALAWSPDGALVISAIGRAIGVWNASSGQLIRVLEGHVGSVRAVAFSPDGTLLASKTGAGETIVRQGQVLAVQRGPSEERILIWRTDTWDICGVIGDKPGGYLYSGLAFSPDGSSLAAAAAEGRQLRLWGINRDRLLQNAPPLESVYYKNAKVALIGDSGVGKSGLMLVLTGDPFVATDSTHARKVKVLKREKVQADNGSTEMRELLIWDLAGQPGYRLIHQLHLDDIATAIIVLDSKSELDPFAGVRHWNRAFLQAKRVSSSAPGTRILVAARVDRGPIGVSGPRIRSLLQELDISDYVETSAKEGIGIDVLKRKIEDSVDWGALPTVTSNAVFQEIKTFVKKRARAKVLADVNELLDDFSKGVEQRAASTGQEFETCLHRLQALGLVRVFSFGRLVLLRPELLDSYASAIIFAAKNEPDGMGSILEDDVRNGRFPIPSEDRLKDKTKEKLLLLATTEDLISHEIALRETAEDGALLVFPSQLTRENPELPDPPGKAAIFEYQGAVLSIYATLVVRLAHSDVFKIKEMWKDATTFNVKSGGACGLYLTDLGGGRGTLTLFFDPECASSVRLQFEDYVYTHLCRRALPNTVAKRRVVVCPMADCGTPITDTAVRKRREIGWDWIGCNVCGTRIPIDLEAGASSETTVLSTREIDRAARQRTLVDTALISASAEMQTPGFSEWAGSDRTTLSLAFTDVVSSTVLGAELGDERMAQVRRAHFQQARKLIMKHKGYEIKTIGDSFMVAFRTATQALSFALEFHGSTGHDAIQIRAGIHVGPVHVEEEDAFGNMVNYAARVVSCAKGAEIWVSDRAFADIQSEKARVHADLDWIRHGDCELKGFKGQHTVWSIAVPRQRTTGHTSSGEMPSDPPAAADVVPGP